MIGLGVTLWSSLTPTENLGVIATVWDKLTHTVGYALLTTVLLLAQVRPRPAVTALGLIAFSALIEVLQALTGYRLGEVSDLVANGFGILAACLVYAAGQHRRRAKADT